MANEVAEKKSTQIDFKTTLTEGLMEDFDALPADFNIPRFVQNSIALLNGNDTLRTYAQTYGLAPIKAGLKRGAYMGLDALNSEFHLIPFGSTLQFILDYRGTIKLMRKYSPKPVKDIYAEVVRQGDDYEKAIVNGEQVVNFKCVPFNDGAVIGAFAVCSFTDGSMVVEEMSLKELEKVRSKSKMSNGMAWKEFPTEMYRKTVIKRLAKRITIDFDNLLQSEIWKNDGAIDTKNEVEVQDFDVPDDFGKETYVESTVVEPVGEELPEFLKG